jgi:hypothetical protein
VNFYLEAQKPVQKSALRFLLDQASAEQLVDPRLADVLFILTISNSVVNPYVYGSYASEMRGKCLKWCGGRRRSAPRSPSGILPIDSRSRLLPSLRLGTVFMGVFFSGQRANQNLSTFRA